MFAIDWIFTLFSSVIPLECMGSFYDNFFGESWIFFYKLVLTIILKCKAEILGAQDAAGVISPIKLKCDCGESIVKKISRLIWTETGEWNQCFAEAKKIKFDESSVKSMLNSYDINSKQFK